VIKTLLSYAVVLRISVLGGLEICLGAKAQQDYHEVSTGLVKGFWFGVLRLGLGCNGSLQSDMSLTTKPHK